ncbi:MAG: DUF2259 domain-containing protein [Treponemataceae bacterium]
MKRVLILVSIFFACSFWSFAGDVAEYCDLGFSDDGRYFVFAQYGITDVDFIPYAEIYTVDVAKNAFLSEGIFKSYPDKEFKKNGKTLFEQLYAKNKKFIDEHSGNKATLEQTLYLRGPESKSTSEQIIFKDFSNSDNESEVFYYINLVKNVTGQDKNLSSSFFIKIERKDENGNVLSNQIAGNPDYKRKNISDYAIRRIISDKAGKYLIFEIDKKLDNEKGTSFRYMVETVELR